MSHPRVVRLGPRVAWDIYVGRSRRTEPRNRWANPYRVSEHGQRAMVLYLDYLERHPNLVELARGVLRDKVLACWCAPDLCHGEVLARLADGETLAAIRADLLPLLTYTQDLFPEVS